MKTETFPTAAAAMDLVRYLLNRKVQFSVIVKEREPDKVEFWEVSYPLAAIQRSFAA